jgi:aminoglycoside 6'-N-acetyltransferase I
MNDAAIELRTAGPADRPELLRLAREFYDEDGFTTSDADLERNFRALFTAPATAHLCLAVDGGSAVAFALTTSQIVLESGLVAELQDLYVMPAYRRHGIAGRLIDDAGAWAKGRGATLLEVVIAPNDRDVSHLFAYYAARGFRDEGRRLLSRTL